MAHTAYGDHQRAGAAITSSLVALSGAGPIPEGGKESARGTYPGAISRISGNAPGEDHPVGKPAWWFPGNWWSREARLVVLRTGETAILHRCSASVHRVIEESPRLGHGWRPQPNLVPDSQRALFPFKP